MSTYGNKKVCRKESAWSTPWHMNTSWATTSIRQKYRLSLSGHPTARARSAIVRAAHLRLYCRETQTHQRCRRPAKPMSKREGTTGGAFNKAQYILGTNLRTPNVSCWTSYMAVIVYCKPQNEEARLLWCFHFSCACPGIHRCLQVESCIQ